MFGWLIIRAIYYSGPPNYILLGDIALPEDRAADFRQVLPIEKAIAHPEYKPPLTYNDIALVKLAAPVTLSQYLLPACLPNPGDKGNDLEAVGFGLLGPGGKCAKFRELQSFAST